MPQSCCTKGKNRRFRLFVFLSTLCLFVAPFLHPSAAQAAAPSLYIYGGQGGDNGTASDKGGQGGQGGYVGDNAAGNTVPAIPADGNGGSAGARSASVISGLSHASAGDGGAGANAGTHVNATHGQGVNGGNAGGQALDPAGPSYTGQSAGGGYGGETYTSSGGGGGGGAAAARALNNATFDSITIKAGQVGTDNGGSNPGTSGSGGSAALYGQRVNISGAGGLVMENTSSWSNSAARATLAVDTLAFTGSGNQALTTTYNGFGSSGFAATIGTLQINQGVTLNAAFNRSGSGNYNVTFDTIHFNGASSSGAALNISTPANFNYNSIRVSGHSNSLFSSQPFSAAGKTLIFEIPAYLAPGQTMLDLGDDADIRGASVIMQYESVRPAIREGQSLTLLAATSLTADQTGLTVQTASGDVYTLLVDNNQLLAVLAHIAPTTPAYDRLKAYAEGRAASLAFVNQGQELLLNQGFGSALAATSGPGFRSAGFGGMGNGKSRYNSGSHVDVEGFSMLAGMAFGNDLGMGRLTLGAFFEGGWGSYDSHNSFSNYASVKGDGDTSYYGGGILGRYDLTSGAFSGLYFDASARMGRAKVDFSTDDIQYSGNDADFDSASLYYGLHGGLGYVWNINEAASLDLSAKLLWTRQEGDSVSVHGDRVRFKDADSLRTRLGGRFTYALNEQFAPYAGAYWEHEFDGKIRSTVNGNGIDAPELKGGTGMGELGLSFRPFAETGAKTESDATGGLSLDLAVQGYTGVRQGVSGSFQFKFEF